MKRSMLTVLMVVVLVLPAAVVGLAQEGTPQPDATAPGGEQAGQSLGVERDKLKTIQQL